VKKLIIICLVYLILTGISCIDEAQKTQIPNANITLFQKISSTQSKINFNNLNEDTDTMNFTMSDYFYMGGGVSVGDINKDNLPDLFFTGNLVTNRLYLNKGNFEFEDITESSGLLNEKDWSISATFHDFNEDGWVDIYVSNAGMEKFYPQPANQLYLNNKDNTFTESINKLGLEDVSMSTQITPFDYDLDGDLDLYLLKHVDFVNRFRKHSQLNDKYAAYDAFFNSEAKKEKWYNTLYENTGNGQFRKNSKAAGLFEWGYGLSAVVADLNKDDFPDIYVTNDYLIPDFMYLNNGDGTFSDQLKQNIQHTSHFAMGCDVADYNNDTYPDIAVVDMTSPDRVRNKTLMAAMDEANFNYAIKKLEYPKQFMFNTFQVNNASNSFSEVANLLNISLTDWSWSSLLADFDLDGDKDYFITNGVKRDARHRDVEQEVKDLVRSAQKKGKKIPIMERLKKFPSEPVVNYLFENTLNYQFEDVSKDWGFTEKSFSNGAAYADLDNDGDLDLVINNINEKAWLFKNTAIENGKGDYLKIKFDAVPQNLNAKVTLYSNGTAQYQEYHPVRGYFSAVEPMVYFGLSNESDIDSLIVRWLHGKEKRLYKINKNQTLLLSINDSDVKASTPLTKIKLLFTKASIKNLNIDYQHKENPYRDFKREILLPHSQSRHGPNVAVADVNGDGLDDFYVGGAHKQAGELYLQKLDGRFMNLAQEAFAADALRENIGAHFFDYDKDGDNDLYVASGGNEFKPYGPALADRLYRNDGKGNFTATTNVIPPVNISGSKVASNDYDGDGDLDLLVAGRILPGNYPIPATSVLLQNNNGKFSNVNQQAIPSFKNLGLVTDFIWCDINQDGLSDIVLVGEWMNIEIFTQNQNNTFDRVSKNYFEEETRGWWYSIAVELIKNLLIFILMILMKTVRTILYLLK